MAEYTYALIRYRWTSEQTTAEQVGGAFLSNKDAKQAMLEDIRSTLPEHAQREEFDFGFISNDGMLVINTQNASYWSAEEEIAWQITYYKPLPHPLIAVGDIVGQWDHARTAEERRLKKKYDGYIPVMITKIELETGNSPRIWYRTSYNPDRDCTSILSRSVDVSDDDKAGLFAAAN